MPSSSKTLWCSYILLLVLKDFLFLKLNYSFLQPEATVEKGATPSASDNVEAATMVESFPPTIPKSESDTFLTTPDEDDDKIINTNTGLEGDGLELRRPKKDLLEIDRFTICGNRIDWAPQSDKPVGALAKLQGSGIRHRSWHMLRAATVLSAWPMEYLFIYSCWNQPKHKAVTRNIGEHCKCASVIQSGPLVFFFVFLEMIDCFLMTVDGAKLAGTAHLKQGNKVCVWALQRWMPCDKWQLDCTSTFPTSTIILYSKRLLFKQTC